MRTITVSRLTIQFDHFGKLGNKEQFIKKKLGDFNTVLQREFPESQPAITICKDEFNPSTDIEIQ